MFQSSAYDKQIHAFLVWLVLYIFYLYLSILFYKTFLNEESKKRCQAVLNRMKRAGYLGEDFKSFAEMCEEADVGLFKAVTSNPDHVMYKLLPPLKNTPYHLRPRVHNFELPDVNNNLKKNFIHRMLYSNSY